MYDICKHLVCGVKVTRRVYFLDRNVISLVKDRCSNKRIDDKDKNRMLYKLKKLDRRSSIVTPLLSLFEGQHGRMEYPSEISNTIEKETQVLKKFFSKADVDDLDVDDLKKKRFYKSLPKEFLLAKGSSDYKKNIQNKIDFLNEVNHLIYQKKSEKDRLKIQEIQEEITSCAEKSIGKKNIVNIATLLCLYNIDVARKILKPKENIKKDHYYNAVMDFQYFNYCIMLTNMCRDYRKNNDDFDIEFEFEFLSLDKSLVEFFSWFNWNESSSISHDGHFLISPVFNDKGKRNIPDQLLAYLKSEKIFD